MKLGLSRIFASILIFTSLLTKGAGETTKVIGEVGQAVSNVTYIASSGMKLSGQFISDQSEKVNKFAKDYQNKVNRKEEIELSYLNYNDEFELSFEDADEE